MRGIELPEEFNGVTLDTYKQLFQDEPAKAKKVMVEFIDSVLEPIPGYKAIPGDIYLLSLEKNPLPFLAICAGNANIISVTESKGVTVFPLKTYKIERAWKCHQ